MCNNNIGLREGLNKTPIGTFVESRNQLGKRPQASHNQLFGFHHLGESPLQKYPRHSFAAY